MIATVYTILVMLVCMLVMISCRRYWFMSAARRDGKLPQGKPTMFDVRQLLMEGKKDLAIDVYCEIFNTTAMKARKDIEELQRSLKV